MSQRLVPKISRYILRFKTSLDFARQRLWWFDVVYPIALAMMLFGTLSYIVYGGRESSRLSLLGERFLLEATLYLVPTQELSHQGQIITVSGDVFEINLLTPSLNGSTPDFPLKIYQNVIQSLVDQGVKNIFVVWRSENHPQSQAYYRPLRDYLKALKSIDRQIRVVFVTNIDEPQGVKFYLGDVATIFDNLPCANAEQEEVQTYCPILPQSPDWIAQWMLNHLFSKGANTEVLQREGPEHSPTDSWMLPSWKTRYLPSTVEGYITNLVNPQQIADVSFSEVLAHRGIDDSRTEYAFVGLDLTGAVAPSSRPAMPIAIKTIYQQRSLRTASFKLDGVPLHQYWATIGQTMLEGRLPSVASRLLVWGLNVAFGGVILFLMFRYGGTTASLTFMIWCFAAPALNVAFLAWMGFYLPIFNSLYVGLSILIMSGFARLSFTTLARWRSEEKSRSHLKAADLKGNFISLLSHNLNTPIAKMQGLIELLVLEKSLVPTHLKCAEYYISQIQLVIKSVLIATALEEGAAKESPRNIVLIIDEFKATYGPLMRQLGIQVVYHPAKATYEELLFLPLAFDLRALTTALAAALALAGMALRETQLSAHNLESVKNPKALEFFSINLYPVVVDCDGLLQVNFELGFAEDASLRMIEWMQAAKSSFNGFRGLVSTDFVRGVLGALVVLTTDFYGGNLGARSEGHGVCMGFVPKN